MDNITRITALGMCTGCGACLNCEHLHLERSSLGFDIPVPDEGCTRCGTQRACVMQALFFYTLNQPLPYPISATSFSSAATTSSPKAV